MPGKITTEYAAGGYDPRQPYDNAARWWDDGTRLAWAVDLTDPARPASSRPYRDDENGRADAGNDRQARLDRIALMRNRIADTISTLGQVGTAAAADLAAAGTAKAAAAADIATTTALKNTLAALAAKGPLLALTDLLSIVTALQSLTTWRAFVDAQLVDLQTARALADTGLGSSVGANADLAQLYADELERRYNRT